MQRAISSASAGHWPAHEAGDSVTLDFDRRHRRRLRLATDSGRELLLDLPRTVALAQGDGLRTDAGGWIEVRAAAEPLLEVHCDDELLLLRLAWHVGNRHVPAELRAGSLRIRPDSVIAAMLRGLGAQVRDILAPFQPEPGAYAGAAAPAHSHGHDHAGGGHAH